jgi:hypothetical protein
LANALAIVLVVKKSFSFFFSSFSCTLCT